ncbi:MAG: pyrroline-5-carboxylate reductase [Candidatus Methylacidiphilales bacterium]|nr:pyrroline-5-carboxylate reductase [Candidatus Methylacidiphilales bacterium]
MNLTLIGAGNLGRALTRGWIKSGLVPPGQITATDRMPEARGAFQAIHPGLRWADSIPAAVAAADVVLWAVKPQQIHEALPEGAGAPWSSVFISVCAGVPLARLQSLSGPERRIVRAMPNTPALVGEGVTALSGNAVCTESDLERARSVFAAVGRVVLVGEKEMNAVTALSGSGPAFFYLLIDLMARAARENGLESGEALRMAAQTARGAAQMILETGTPPRELMAQVTSKGGTTEAGLKILDSARTEALIRETISAAARRSEELANG